ncbi:MAG: glycosyltransferase family 4 protein [Tahibacter sp.]
MRVLILAQHISRALGGIEIQCDLIAHELLALGHEVHYAVVMDKSRELPTAEYPLHRWTPGNTAQTATLFDSIRADIVYLRHNKIALRATARAAARAGVPLVFAASSLQDVEPWSYHRQHVAWSPRRLASVAWQRIKSRWNWSGFHWVSAAISLNQDYTDRLPVTRRTHIPDAMDSVAESFEWPRPFVVWVAQIKDYKNPGDYVELARRCVDLDLDFLMVGQLISKRYRWIADSSRSPANFHYLGAKTPVQVNGVLAAAMALVHTCDPEGFGNNFIQAWLQGTPSFSLRFDPGGVITRERLGSVPGNLVGLERDLRALVANKSERAAMGARALRYARENHDPAINTRRLASFLLGVVKERPQP